MPEEDNKYKINFQQYNLQFWKPERLPSASELLRSSFTCAI